ncbi:MAG TPA: FMN-dependent NADH-azoreductase [Terracidiphilus sp.]|jgi:FMN-dependent NADH-azoreductase|nr:FMN-dependent NADH-azoreductase [Terracidiphilus sp.]
MPTLLQVDSSPLGESSISRRLSREFVQQWQKAHPQDTIITRDLTTSNLKAIDAEWIGATFTPENARTDGQKQLLTLSDALIAELERADEYVFGVPMHNFSIPSTLKLWIDQISRAGKTFAYTAAGPNGLLKNKKATFLVASGGVYGSDTPMAAFNFVEPYLRSAFGFIGVTDTTFIHAGGAAAIHSGKTDREAFLQPHFESIRAAFKAA